MKEKAILLICVLAGIFCPAAIGKIIYVDDDATGANDGSSWENAYVYLQDALADANSAEKPVEIRVAQGIYKPDMGAGITPGDREASFQLREGIALSGGYAGILNSDPNKIDYEKYETILSGDLDGNDIYTNDPNIFNSEPTRQENSYYVIITDWPDSASLLDGFTVSGGNGKIPTSGGRGGGGRSGGGIKIGYGKLRIYNCTFTNNVGIKGGGVFVEYGELILINCTFKDNIANEGGGIYNYSDTLKLIDCTFENNYAKNYGGGMYDDYRRELSIERCNFKGNSAINGGGMYIEYIHDIKSFTNCLFNNNSAVNSGGAIYIEEIIKNIEITNFSFAGNSAVHGKALALSSEGDPRDIKLQNCIFWNGGQDEIWNNILSKIEINYSNIQNGQSSIYDPNGLLVWGDGNIDADPLFADPNNGDYHLKSQAGRFDSNIQSWVIDSNTSPCIDAGDPNSPIGLEPFPNGGYINMGAYGGTSEASKSYFGEPVCETIIAGDINGDCIVDFADVEILLQHWLENGRPVNPKVIDGIEFRVQTDKTFYNLGESVQMTFNVTNLTNEKVNIGCYQAPEFNLSVEKDENNIWELYNAFLFHSPGINLEAGESQELSYSWDMKDSDGYLVGPGTYHVVGIIYNTPYAPDNYLPTEVRIPITISEANSP